MKVPLACAVCVPGVCECGDYGEDVGGCGEEESFYVPVVEGFDDGGEEVCYGGGGDDTED